MTHERPNLLQLSNTLRSLHFQGYRPIPGYTVNDLDDPYPGAVYIAVAAERPEAPIVAPTATKWKIRIRIVIGLLVVALIVLV
jgi:hypothetical protein